MEDHLVVQSFSMHRFLLQNRNIRWNYWDLSVLFSLILLISHLDTILR